MGEHTGNWDSLHAPGICKAAPIHRVLVMLGRKEGASGTYYFISRVTLHLKGKHSEQCTT